ncbi:MAG: FadR family transcriptional regulator [Desulfovibrionaceae bacterium]|jgi:GntR family transcriptional repressor for pyruvate dehydrogenase complex|nr:FadR family transcriptional regulator [Desulfovibrionaceae bacterium]
MGPIRKVRLSESVVDAIRQMIADQGFAPGDRFLSENELAERLQVSRSSVREAVRMLEVTGQVSVRHGKGIFIADSATRQFEGFVDWLRDNGQSIREHFEVRLMIEPHTARLAAENATDEEVERLSAVHEDFVRNAARSNTDETIRSDREFHKLLAKATHNRTLFALTKSMTASLLDGWISSFHTPGRMDKTVHEHGLILEAVREKDAEAAKRHMRTHLENAIRDIKSSLHQPS